VEQHETGIVAILLERKRGKKSNPEKALAHGMSPPSNRKASQRSLNKS